VKLHELAMAEVVLADDVSTSAIAMLGLADSWRSIHHNPFAGG